MTYCANPGAKLGLDLDAIEKSLRRGTAIKRVCARHGCKPTTVYEIARARNVPLRLRRLTDAEYFGVVEALKAGRLHREIAAQFGIKMSTVWRVAEKNDLRRNPRRGMPIYEVCRAYELGKSCREIGDAVGFCEDTIRRALRRKGKEIGGYGKRATMAQLRECVRQRMTGADAARRFGAKPTGDWYARWDKAKKQVAEGIA